MELIAELTPIRRNDDCRDWRPRVFASERPDGTWAAWLQFKCGENGQAILTSGIETTQANRDAVAYWATGLEDVYLEGALDRATPAGAGDTAAARPAPAAANPVHLQQIDLYVLDFLRRAGTPRVETKSLFDDQVYANADLVRSFEYLEQNHRLLLRSTEGGRDWLELTDHGFSSINMATMNESDVQRESMNA